MKLQKKIKIDNYTECRYEILKLPKKTRLRFKVVSLEKTLPELSEIEANYPKFSRN